MIVSLRSALVCLILLATLGCTPSGAQDGNSKQQVERPANTSLSPRKKIELFIFTAKWCDVCTEVPPLLNRLQKEFTTISVRDLDIDQEDNFKLYAKYKGENKDGLPYLFVIVDGQAVAQQRGLLPYDKIAQWLQDAIAQHGK